MNGFASYALFGSLVLYLIVGGIILWGLEYEHQGEEHQRKERRNLDCISMLKDVDKLLAFLQDDALNHSSDVVKRNLQNLTSRVRETLHQLNETFANIDSSAGPIWDIPGSIFFALTVVTTIGYGHLSPGTFGGQLFCCIYALFGIPLCLLVLLRIGKKLSEIAEKLEVRIFGRGDQSGARRYLRSAVVLSFGVIVFLFIPSAVFKRLEGWSYGSALYFSVVSLSTIGFGDLVAGISYAGSYGALYRIMATVWLFLGLSWLSVVINCAQDSLQTIVTHFNEKPLLSDVKHKTSGGQREEETDLNDSRKVKDADDIEKRPEDE